LKTDNIDDLLIKCFSRSQKGRKKKWNFCEFLFF
jgi:hypothetical protein